MTQRKNKYLYLFACEKCFILFPGKKGCACQKCGTVAKLLHRIPNDDAAQ